MRFEVQTLIGNDWENVWSEDGEPLTFANPVEAETAMHDHLNECKAAGIEVSPSDFQIRVSS